MDMVVELVLSYVDTLDLGDVSTIQKAACFTAWERKTKPFKTSLLNTSQQVFCLRERLQPRLDTQRLNTQLPLHESLSVEHRGTEHALLSVSGEVRSGPTRRRCLLTKTYTRTERTRVYRVCCVTA
ncbi:hypothetical protein SKAU_G00033690 [Synaphobranchus kaupii]|uniref:Uncharacterized protein n=1 Tax=Synaphobranchus kaupii TaxID=118154 RepID=A0A9Q1GE55_SYNKA|nr:hypothetical protein SKAU_G00033690 [Synaphobranchus kaupii]